jgi:hypothetical protein
MAAAGKQKVYVLRVNPRLLGGWARELPLPPQTTYLTRARAELERQFHGSDEFVIDEIEKETS